MIGCAQVVATKKPALAGFFNELPGTWRLGELGSWLACNEGVGKFG